MRAMTRYALAVVVLGAAVGGGSVLAGELRTGSGASAADDREMRRIADDYLGRRADAVTTAPDRPRVPAEGLTPPMATALRGDLDALTARGRTLHDRGAGYARAETGTAADAAEVAGGTATLDVDEQTRLFHENAVPGSPAYEEYVLTHTLTFLRTGDGRWLLAADRPHTGPGDLLPVTQPTRP